MLGFLNGLSLRAKITASFVLIVLGGAAVSAAIGSRIIAQALLVQAHQRVHHGLEAARMAYASRLDRVRRIVTRAAQNERLAEAVWSQRTDPRSLQEILAIHRQKEGALDFLAIVDPRGGRVLHGGGGWQRGVPRLEVVHAATTGRVAEGTELLQREDLLAESTLLGERAQVRVLDRGAGIAGDTGAVESALVLAAAAPIMAHGEIVGLVYGGVLLNNDVEMVDQMQELIFGREQYKGSEVGAVSIFLGPVRVATNLMVKPGERAVGTVLRTEIGEAVLKREQRWSGRAFVLGGEHVTDYEPIRDITGRVIGVLGVGMPERPFLAVRTEMMLSFLVVAAIGVAIVLGLTYLITRSMIHPLEEMVAGTKRIATGDLEYRVSVRAKDEIGLLASSFNHMLDSLNAMKGELQEWARTLEEKVQQRTDELVAVQKSMAQSEKLASLGRLAAGVAHEINNPLGGILSFSMLAIEECTDGSPMRKRLDLISKQALRCRDIVKGLLEFSRQSDFAPAPTDVNAAVEKTLSLLANQAMFHNIKLEEHLQESLPPVHIDSGQLQQVVMNIVLNAVDAMEQSGVLSLRTAEDKRAGEVLLSISDTGKGIPEELLPLIFEPFFTTKKVGQGTGLGLAIVHGIVTRVGGRVEVKSSKTGTTFIIHFSCKGAGHDAAERQVSADRGAR